jgi:hypothetical protein
MGLPCPTTPADPFANLGGHTLVNGLQAVSLSGATAVAAAHQPAVLNSNGPVAYGGIATAHARSISSSSGGGGGTVQRRTTDEIMKLFDSGAPLAAAQVQQQQQQQPQGTGGHGGFAAAAAQNGPLGTFM